MMNLFIKTSILKTITLFLCIFLLDKVVFCQSSVDINRKINLPNIIAASPEAAILGKFGQIPVSNYRGVPDISIPLYTIKEGSIELPISLSYHAGGIKVEEMAPCTGLGWALSAGGVITRSLKGLPDENGYFSSYNNVYRFITGQMTQAERNTFLLGVYRKSTDAEPDIFYYNFGGVSGKFSCAEDGNLYASPRSDLKITYDNTQLFTITDGKGMIYRFTDKELTMTEPFCDGNNNDESQAVTAWYLTNIEDPFGNKINFTYVPGGTGFKTKSVDTKSVNIGLPIECGNNSSSCYNVNSVSRPAISEISFSNGKIKFEYSSTQRLDGGGLALQSISMLNLNNETIKSFRLYTGYYTTNNIGGCEDGINYRLRLDSLQETGNNNVSVPSYKFYYNQTQMPCRLSNAQDYWGYYNGKNNSIFLRYKNADNGPWLGANKEPDSVYAKAGVLEKIVYPTGGRTEFNFEGNTYSYFVPAAFDVDNPIPFSGFFLSNSNNNGNYLVTTQQAFTIQTSDISSPGYAYLKADVSTSTTDPNVINNFVVRVTGDNGYVKTLGNGDTLHLTAGNYTLYGSIETEFAGVPHDELTVELNKILYQPDRYLTKLYGGIRIHQIGDFNESGTLAGIKTYSYNSFDIPNWPGYASSADYSALPDNQYYTYVKQSCPAADKPCCTYRLYNSMSNYPLLNTSGSPIGYRNVTVYDGPDGKNGKEEYTYTSYTEFPDNVSFQLPFFFASEYDWQKGLMVKNTSYKYFNGSYITVKKQTNKYDTYDSGTKKIARGVVVGMTYDPIYTDSANILRSLAIATYNVESDPYNVVSDTTMIYDQGTPANYQTLINSYEYNLKNFKIKRRKTLANSKGEQITQNFTYALDYSASSANNNNGKSLWALQSRNIISAPIESYSTRIRSGTEYVMNGTINKYNNDLPVIDTIYSLETTGLTLLSNFQPSTVDGNNNFAFYPAYAPRIIQSKYTDKGRIAELYKQSDSKISYLWDYKGLFPIAEAKNADNISIAYTSFEADGTGSWNVVGSLRSAGGITGNQYYQLSNGALTKNNLNTANQYIVSYWSTNGSYTVSGSIGAPVQGRSSVINGVTWTYFQHDVTGVTSVTVTGSGNIDELRLYPKGAEMTTYTYQPLIGITSQCDARNYITYYEYDELSRLLRIRNADNKILKQFDYKYQVFASSNAVWTTTGNTRCKPCPGGGNYITNILQQEEKDVNPQSATYNQTRWTDTGVSGNCVISADWQNTGSTQCLTDGSGYRTGVQRVEQRDMNPCSNTYNQLQYVNVTNTSACPPNAPNWQNTGNTRCKPCPANGNYITNIQQQEQRDLNTNSSTYNQTRWIDAGTSSNCVIQPDWRFISATRCQKDLSNVNTGDQEQEQMDMNPCSSTYNQLRWIDIGPNPNACPLPCPGCTGPDKKCIRGNCETGVRVCTSSTYDSSQGVFVNTYHYEWSDGSWSADFMDTGFCDCWGINCI